MRQYSNFDEIERDLKLLKLQQDIQKEKIILNLNRTKESVSPMAIVKSLVGSIFKSAIVLKLATKVLALLRGGKK